MSTMQHEGPMESSFASNGSNTAIQGGNEAAASASQQTSPNNLFVAGLPKEYGDTHLMQLFAPFGEIVSAKVMLDLKTGASRQFGFVSFKNAAEAASAVNGMRNFVPEGGLHPLHVTFARHDDAAFSAECDRLYVRNLPPWVTAPQLSELFAQYGKIVEASVLADGPNATKNKGVGFVRFQTVEEARRAIAAVHETKPFDSEHALLVRYIENATMRHARQNRRASRGVEVAGAPNLNPNSRRSSALNTPPQVQQQQQQLQQQMVHPHMFPGQQAMQQQAMHGFVFQQQQQHQQQHQPVVFVQAPAAFGASASPAPPMFAHGAIVAPHHFHSQHMMPVHFAQGPPSVAPAPAAAYASQNAAAIIPATHQHQHQQTPAPFPSAGDILIPPTTDEHSALSAIAAMGGSVYLSTRRPEGLVLRLGEVSSHAAVVLRLNGSRVGGAAVAYLLA